MIERSHCSITVANYDETWLIRFVSKSYTHMWKSFANKFRLVLHACIRHFVKKISWCHPNMAQKDEGESSSPPADEGAQTSILYIAAASIVHVTM